ncbi:hypothetical protein ONA02_02515 [Mycoplasmopsis felis]|uniref:hypothetical protein n=1 Tax=Mycoplasmopsis felis TaxID=33923 RepID=UPI002285CFA5|nr:hypothetical protein [Mycoplasmopsis felis]WAM02678.1 hypothetical protein ONA02_02515 [Mycoplasmopsis felis]
MLQPKRLKNRWTKLTRWFNVRDAIEIIVICALTYTLSWVIFKDFEMYRTICLLNYFNVIWFYFYYSL